MIKASNLKDIGSQTGKRVAIESENKIIKAIPKAPNSNATINTQIDYDKKRRE